MNTTTTTSAMLNDDDWMYLVLAFLFGAVILFLVAFGVPAQGRDLSGQYAESPLHDWFSHLKNANGGLCCDFSDGHRIEDVDWKGEADGTYSVRVNGEWVKLTKEQVVNEPNRLGQAVVWIWMGKITCFMPGALS